MDHEYYRELIGRRLTDSLTEAEDAALQAHLNQCEDCAREELELRQLTEALSRMDEGVRAPEDLMQEVRAKIKQEKSKRSRFGRLSPWALAGTIAAALAVCILGGSLLLTAMGGAASSSQFAYDGGVYDMPMGSVSAPQEAGGGGAVNGMGMDISPASYVAEADMVEAPAEAPEEEAVAEVETAPVPVPEEEGEGVEHGLKIIRTADISAQSENFDEDKDAIIRLTEEKGGFISAQSVSGTALAAGQSGYGRNLSLTLRIPAEALDDFLTQSEGVGVVQYANVYEEDVTDQYVDTDRRLQGYQAQYDRILELMEKAETVEELISIESELTRIEYQIESLTGSLRSMDTKVNYSTVYYSLAEVRRAQPVQQTLWQRMQTSLRSTLDSIVQRSQDFVVWLYSSLPVLGILAVLCGIVAVVIVACVRKRRGNKTK